MELIGHKTTAFIDLWSICHFFLGVAIGNIVINVLGRKGSRDDATPYLRVETITLVLLLVVAYGWEFLEYGLESGYGGESIAYWYQGREHWLNRLVSDPFFMVLGYVFSRRFRLFVWPARLLLVAWLWVFVFLLPNSMAYM